MKLMKVWRRYDGATRRSLRHAPWAALLVRGVAFGVRAVALGLLVLLAATNRVGAEDYQAAGRYLFGTARDVVDVIVALARSG